MREWGAQSRSGLWQRLHDVPRLFDRLIERERTDMVVEQQAFFAETIKSWDALIGRIGQLSSGKWLYRGQAQDWCLKSTLERSIDDWGLDLKDTPELEAALAREFQRRVRGEEQSLVQENMLYCLALMQHHGAPTRLLDCTYSPFVAAQTALRKGLKDVPVIWCFNSVWMEEEHCRPVLGPANDRLERQRRADTLFKLKLPPLLVMPDTPYFLNERLTAHQGAFLCTGNISKPFVENLKAMIGWTAAVTSASCAYVLIQRKGSRRSRHSRE